jgi:hypothetical protein
MVIGLKVGGPEDGVPVRDSGVRFGFGACGSIVEADGA